MKHRRTFRAQSCEELEVLSEEWVRHRKKKNGIALSPQCGQGVQVPIPVSLPVLLHLLTCVRLLALHHQSVGSV